MRKYLIASLVALAVVDGAQAQVVRPNNGTVTANAAPASNAPEYRKATGFEQVKAGCELMADGAEAGSFAFGPPAFMLGVGIQRSIDHARAYDNCMALKGYVRNDH